jgi:cytochrome c peroxidase
MNAIRLMPLVLALVACQSSVVEVPERFPPMPVPADNKLTPERVELGRKLFHDKSLSRTGEVSCASCHLQQNAFSDPNRVSIGVQGRTGTRNAPALINLAWNTSFFWDGGVKTLEQQVIGPLTNPLEMDMTMEEVVARVAKNKEYVELSQDAYDSAPQPAVITKAIAAYMRTLVSGNSRYDHYLEGDTGALTAQEKQGMEIALGERGECFHCHVGFNLTNNNFSNNGMNTSDLGRAKVTEDLMDEGKFKVPTLRNVAVSAPYMHDGSLATLEDVVEHYAHGGDGHPNTDATIRPLELTAEDKAAVVAWLKTLTDEAFLKDKRYGP